MKLHKQQNDYPTGLRLIYYLLSYSVHTVIQLYKILLTPHQPSCNSIYQDSHRSSVLWTGKAFIHVWFYTNSIFLYLWIK